MMTIVLISIFALGCLYIAIVIKEQKVQLENNLKKEKEAKMKKIMNIYVPYFLSKLEKATALDEIFLLHKLIWSNVPMRSIGPDPYGYFRTTDIITMSKEEVFLGGINGLWTKPLNYWEQNPEPEILEQYRNHLINNLKHIQRYGYYPN